jgi:hypothetical protein
MTEDDALAPPDAEAPRDLTRRPTRAGGYQMLPPMAPAQFEALKTDIAERGVLTPIDVDEHGHILDGHHRLRACAELGVTDYPVFVRVGLSEVEKRTFARQVNTLRRHLSRSQMRALVAGQLRDTPTWANARIARLLGVDGKTVTALRRRLEATSEIPRLTAFEGADGKARPSTQPTRAIFVANWPDLSWDDLTRLAAQAAAVPPDQRRGLFTAHGIPTIEDTSYNVFAGCSADEVWAWHVFGLFLLEQGWSTVNVSMHVEWIRGRPFQSVDAWLGEAGVAFRRRWGLPSASRATLTAWRRFIKAQAGRTLADIGHELGTRLRRGSVL